MRFVHISDLHLGKRLKEKSLEEDQRYILNQILDIIDQQHPDGVLIAGDVFDDGNNTTVESIRMLDDFLTELSKKDMSTYMISGNHDSMDRLNFGSRIFNENHIFISGTFSGKANRFTLSRNGEDVDVYLLPFVKPAHVRRYYPDERIESYDDAIACVLRHSGITGDNKKVLVTHQFIVSGTDTPMLSDSERSFVGGTEAISAAQFGMFDYVALGHIHSPQYIGKETVRYCGSPLKYSLSEKDNEKSVTIIDIDDEVRITTVPLRPLRDLRFIKGPLDAIISAAKDDPARDDFIYVQLDRMEMNAMARLREVYPNVMSLDFVRNTDTDLSEETIDVEHLDALTEFSKFFSNKTGEELTESQRKLVKELLETNGVVL